MSQLKSNRSLERQVDDWLFFGGETPKLAILGDQTPIKEKVIIMADDTAEVDIDWSDDGFGRGDEYEEDGKPL